jgi:transcriptional regulator with XRE-family HTH domain
MTDDNWTRIGELVTRRMEELTVRQAEVAQRAGLSDATVRHLMRGTPRGAPDSVTLRRLSVALGWTSESLIDAMLGGDVRDDPTFVPYVNAAPGAEMQAMAAKLRALEAEILALADEVTRLRADPPNGR